MNVVIVVAELLIGLAYTALGALTVYEMVRERHTLGRSQFGLAFAAMAFTCGPHHLLHGLMAATDPAPMHNAEVLLSLLVGLPPGLVFVALRIEVLRGAEGGGDRLLRGVPNLVPFLGVFVGVLGGAILAHSATEHFRLQASTGPSFAANLVLSASYVAVGCYILTTQIRRHVGSGHWSLSGVALGFVFPTCALVHLTHVFTAGPADAFGRAITWADVAGTPAAIWFLVVVRRLYREGLADWNRRPLVGRGLAPRRCAPWEPAEAAL